MEVSSDSVCVKSSPKPKVSVGLPVYNGEKYVAEAIESVLSQSFMDFELVISDNASSDGTQAICRSYAAKDARIRYFRSAETVGACHNFQRVFDLSVAPYFKWAFHDDLFGPEFLEKCVAVLDARPDVVLAYPRSAFINDNGQILQEHNAGCKLSSSVPSERVSQYLREASPACHPVFGLVRRNALQKTTLLAPYINSDVVLLLQLALIGKIEEVPERMFFCREHDERTCTRFETYAELAAWHDPAKGHRWQAPRWRLALEFCRSVGRAKLGIREAFRCYLCVLKWCRWHYRPFLRDIMFLGRRAPIHLTESR